METRSQLKVALTYGAIIGLANAIVYLVFHYSGADIQSKSPVYIGYVISIVGIVYALKSYRDEELGGFIFYGKALGTGTLIGLFYGIIAAIFTLLLFTVIEPDLTQKMIESTQQKLAEKGMTEDQMEIAMVWTRRMMTPPFMFMLGVIGNVFMAFIFSLVISAFVKKDANPFENKSADAL